VIQSLQTQRNELKHLRRATPRKVNIADLTEANFHQPETNHRFIYQLV